MLHQYDLLQLNIHNILMATCFNCENYGNIYFVITKEWLCVMCVELHCEVALDDGCDESGFKVDYPFTGLS
jgi:hypothetical protein